ncbi:AMP-binding protein [Alkaliflexus imshenetskii]|uniref:AMP-binding protein n=1 Tax=Alkaliflexus imshenetskii TaxID=286730 RepID=UPI00047D90D5|nr:AMP-binding protein [Alkaliflexus imshenetskii]
MLKNHGAKTAITFGNDQISYGNMFGKIEKFSASFELGDGEHAVIYSENRPGWFYAFYSIWYKKGVAIPIDFMATISEVAYILKDSTPSVVIVSADKKADMEAAISEAGILTQIVVIDELDSFEPELTSSNGFPNPEPNNTAVIIYTSGTTGSPKGVMLTYENLLANIRGVAEYMPIYHPNSRVMVLLPLHHIFPLLGTMIAPMYVGGMSAISPSMTSEDIMKTLQNNKITILIGVPRLYAAIRKGIVDKINKSGVARMLFALAKKVDSQKFSRKIFGTVHKKFGGAMEYLVSGGAALDPEVGNDFKTLGFEVLEGYGMTELAPMITFTRPGRVRIGSPGEALPGTQIRIVEDEITVTGANVMKGYYKRPEETAEVIKDGWLYTGDLGFLDEEGYLYITGRKKEIIVLSNGKNVNPVELEEKILASDLVKDCGVFFHEEQIQAVIVTEDSQDDNNVIYEKIRAEVIEPLNMSVSSYKRVMSFYLTREELPRTRLGKLQRFKLKEYAHAEQTESVTEEIPQSEEYNMLAGFINLEKGKKVKPHHHLELDLGMDSLDRVGLQVYIHQNFGIDIEAAELSNFGSVAKLAEYVAEKKTKMEDGIINWTEILREKVHFKLPVSWYPTSIMMRLSKFFFKIYFRYRSKGEDNIPEGPCIIAPNHQSYFDGLFVSSLLRTRQIRKTYFYAKAQHVKLPFLKFLAQRNNVIVVDLNRNLKESIQKLAEVLKNQKNIIIFPEGTRSLTGDLGQFKKTFAILSRELNIPVVPVSIKGAINALPKGSIFPRPWKKIEVEFLQPVYPEGNSYEHIADTVRNRIINNIEGGY